MPRAWISARGEVSRVSASSWPPGFRSSPRFFCRPNTQVVKTINRLAPDPEWSGDRSRHECRSRAHIDPLAIIATASSLDVVIHFPEDELSAAWAAQPNAELAERVFGINYYSCQDRIRSSDCPGREATFDPSLWVRRTADKTGPGHEKLWTLETFTAVASLWTSLLLSR